MATRARRIVLGLTILMVSPVIALVGLRTGLALADSVLERRYPPPGVMISVGGHSLHLFCQGRGRPTVVIETGLGVDWVSWAPIVTDLAGVTTVCVYDRAGYGWSEPGPAPRTAVQIAAELSALLSSSGQPAPFVLVAHSFGGHVARLYASEHEESLAALVLIDPSDDSAIDRPAEPEPERPRSIYERVVDLVPPLGWERVKRLYRGEAGLPSDLRMFPPGFVERAVIGTSLRQLGAEEGELAAMAATEAEVRVSRFPSRIPLTVITPTGREGVVSSEDHESISRARQAELAASSASGRQVLADGAGHFVHVDRPDVVIAVMREAVTQTSK